ncbi:unnamed protein product [Lactuca virosa]|uniref:EF-hand domain-containing protein n=1 Tax=Lactuca virosa TaxID=75947 RepID=A0AAU9PQ25_9ASTR|nr:unnamed protein product [Lactuca virosa]
MNRNGIRGFSRFDTNGDRKISVEELVHAVKALGSDISTEEAKQVMAKLDADCDDFINLEEFIGFYKENTRDQEVGINELHDAFELYDLNKNGLISSTRFIRS